MRIAALQMNSTPDKDQNMIRAYDLLQQALKKGVDLIAFPEIFNQISPTGKELRAGAETLRGITVQTLQEWAIEHGVWILAGSLMLTAKSKSGVTNTSLLISPDGEIIGRYDKIHLFDADVETGTLHRESAHVLGGTKPCLAEIDAQGEPIKVGLSICYDLRFPELYRAYAEKKAEILFIPSAFTAATGQAHWDVLTRARAIENQAYVIAPAQTGSPYEGREFWGHTRIIDPWGRVLAERPKGEGVVWADLDFNRLEEIRRTLPALEHRKLHRRPGR